MLHMAYEWTYRHWLNPWTVTGQLWSLVTTTIQVWICIQLNTVLFGKTLVRKDVVPFSLTVDNSKDGSEDNGGMDDEDDFSGKVQIMMLMTTDVNCVSDFLWHMFSLVGKWLLCHIWAILTGKHRFTCQNHHWNPALVQPPWGVMFHWSCCHLPIFATEPLWRQSHSEFIGELDENMWWAYCIDEQGVLWPYWYHLDASLIFL